MIPKRGHAFRALAAVAASLCEARPPTWLQHHAMRVSPRRSYNIWQEMDNE